MKLNLMHSKCGYEPVLVLKNRDTPLVSKEMYVLDQLYAYQNFHPPIFELLLISPPAHLYALSHKFSPLGSTSGHSMVLNLSKI